MSHRFGFPAKYKASSDLDKNKWSDDFLFYTLKINTKK